MGAFFFGFIAGCSLPVPLPYLVVTFTLGGMLNPALVGGASGIGAGIGGTVFYLFGHGGRRFLLGIDFSSNFSSNTGGIRGAIAHWMSRVVGWAERRGSVVVFVMSAMFNPFFVPMAIAMGTTRFRLAKFLFWCVTGNVVKSLFIAYCGYFGLGTLLRWLGLF